MSHSGHGTLLRFESWPSFGSEPARGVNDFAIDLDLEVEVAARGRARSATEGNHVAAADGLAYLDAGGGEVVVGGFKAIAVIHHYAIAAAVLVPANEGHGAAGSSQDRGSALCREVLATVKIAGAAGNGADPEAERRDCNQLG